MSGYTGRRNVGPEEAHLVIVPRKVDDPRAESERVESFWP